MEPHNDTDDYSLPAKSVDPTADLEDRLTDNVRHQIGPARYFLRDADGEPTEDWHGVFNRVARNVAIAELAFQQDAPLEEPAASQVRADDVTALVDEDSEAYQHYDAVAGDFEQAMREQRFIPNSPTLMNAGGDLQQLAACFVNSPEDSMEDIFQTAKEWGLVQKTGGGMGGAFHHLRPKGARVSSTGGVSSGPVSFMRLFDEVAGTVKQGGKRRGAQMAILHVQHPDIGRFAVSKRGEDTFTNFNISMGLTDEFFEAVKNDDTYTLYDPEAGYTEPESFEAVPESAHFYDPRFEDAWNDELQKPGMGLDGKTVQENFWRDYQDEMQDPEAFDEFRARMHVEPGEPLELPARFVWQLLIDGAHNNGEPGAFYLDETQREHSFDIADNPEYSVHATNPCAEQPLCEYESCNLGHINLSLMVDEDAPDWREFDGDVDAFLDEALDMELLEDTARTGVRFLDNVVTMSDFPLPEIEEKVRSMRKIGLGVMGYHQMLIQMGVEYGSLESYEIGNEVMRRIDQLGTETSHGLAGERGPFPAYERSKFADPEAYPEWFEIHAHQDPADYPDGYAMRNHNVTTVAPTGTTSIIGDTSGGIEPIYQVAYFKNVGNDIQGDDMLVEFDDYFLRTLEHNGLDVDAIKDEAERQMRNNEFDGVDSLDAVPEEIGELFVTTQDLDVEQHIRTQAAFQRYCDSGISKTLNIANEATIDEVGDALELAMELGIKGTTVYRDGSRSEQVNTTRVDNNLDDQLEDVEDDTLLDLVEERATEDPEFFQAVDNRLEAPDEPVRMGEN